MIKPFVDEVADLGNGQSDSANIMSNITMATVNSTLATTDSNTIATDSNQTIFDREPMATTLTTIGEYLSSDTVTDGMLLNSTFNGTITSTLAPSLSPVATPVFCNGNYTWIYDHFGQCVLSPVQLSGFILGLIGCIMAWVVAHVFYIRAVTVDYRHSPTRISTVSLMLTVAADFLNFAGSVTSSQLPTMVIVSVYLLVMDIVRLGHTVLLRMGGQQWCYEQMGSRYQERWEKFFLFSPWLMSTMTYLFSPGMVELGKVELWPPQSQDLILVHRSRMLLQVEDFDDSFNLLTAGYVMGILMVPLYFLSAIPELIKVFQTRRSTPYMVVYYLAALVADGLYLASIYTQSLQTKFLLHTLPWTVARTGVCGLHVGILIQICIIKGTYSGSDESRMSLLSKRFDDSDDETLYSRDSGYVGRESLELEDIPKRNRYIKKMRKIGKQMEGTNPFEMESSEDDGFSDDEETSLVTSQNRKSRVQTGSTRQLIPTGPRPLVVISDLENESDTMSLTLDLDPETLQHPLSEEEITYLLDSEYQHLQDSNDNCQGTPLLKIKNQDFNDENIMAFT